MPKIKSNHQGVKGAFYLVNPGGAIHSCDREHAKGRLRQPGWRLAEDSEIEVYLETKVQRHDRPICEPWTPEPEVEAFVPESQEAGEPEATEDAANLAEELGVDLAKVKGSGAGGRILVKDVRNAPKTPPKEEADATE